MPGKTEVKTITVQDSTKDQVTPTCLPESVKRLMRIYCTPLGTGVP